MTTIFVIGPPRSGTTLMLDLLARHPDVTAHAEDFHLFHHDLMLFRERQDREEHFHLTTADATPELKERYQQAIARARQESGRRCFVLKISTLSQQVDYVKALCPQARFVQLVRDGRDAACSMEDLRQTLEKEQGHPRDLGPAPDPLGVWCVAHKLPHHLVALASWSYHVTRSFLDLRFAGADSFLRVRYEDLLLEPAGVMTRVLRFMGLPASTKVERALAGVSDAPGEPGGLGFSTSQAAGGKRRRRFEAELSQPLRVVAAPLIAGPMRLLGYDADPVPDDASFAAACASLGVDAGLWRARVNEEVGWFERQLSAFAPERLLRQADEPTPTSRPLLVDGVMVGSTQRVIDGRRVEGTSFVAKQERRFLFPDADGRWSSIVLGMTGASTVEDIESGCGLGPEGRAVLAKLHGLGFVSYV
jgi:hypothetical protein